jgi:outer membrane protein assembly factor BamE (lipoprotein component of BamABCDE complex)
MSRSFPALWRTRKGERKRMDCLGVLRRRCEMAMKRVLVACLCLLFLCGCTTPEKRSDKIRSEHPEWDANTVSKLAAMNIENGMTGAMVQAALGTASSVSKQGEEEVWAYTAWREDAYLGPKAYEEVVYTVRFKGDKVVGTKGDTYDLVWGVF